MAQKEPKTDRKRTPKSEEDLARDRSQRIIFRDNLLSLYNERTGERAKLAKALNISQSTVSGWTAENGNSIPRGARLEQVAAYFGKDIDWFLTDHSRDNGPESISYYHAVRRLKPFVMRGYVDITQVIDPILRYLVEEDIRIMEDPHINASEKRSWEKTISGRFRYPIPDVCCPEIIEYVDETYPDKVRSADRLIMYSRITRMMTEDEDVKKKIAEYAAGEKEPV